MRQPPSLHNENGSMERHDLRDSYDDYSGCEEIEKSCVDELEEREYIDEDQLRFLNWRKIREEMKPVEILPFRHLRDSNDGSSGIEEIRFVDEDLETARSRVLKPC